MKISHGHISTNTTSCIYFVQYSAICGRFSQYPDEWSEMREDYIRPVPATAPHFFRHPSPLVPGSRTRPRSSLAPSTWQRPRGLIGRPEQPPRPAAVLIALFEGKKKQSRYKGYKIPCNAPVFCNYWFA